MGPETALVFCVLSCHGQVQTLGLKTPLEFNEGDVGMAGGIQARSHITIRYPVCYVT